MKFTTILLSLFFLVSCSSGQTGSLKNIDPWEFLEKGISENWQKTKIKKLLGDPDEISNDKKNNLVTWVYNNKKSNFQEWVFGFNNQGKLEGLLFRPAEESDDIFNPDSIIARWSQLGCEKGEKKFLSAKHVNMETHFISCDRGLRYIELNKYNQVMLIKVSSSIEL